MRPWKRTVFVPRWPVKERVPASRSRVHLRALRFLRVGATHLFLTLRPGLGEKNASCTGAARLSANVILVPTGGRRFFLESWASFEPRRQVLGLTVTRPTAGSAGVVKVASA